MNEPRGVDLHGWGLWNNYDLKVEPFRWSIGVMEYWSNGVLDFTWKGSFFTDYFVDHRQHYDCLLSVASCQLILGFIAELN